MSERFLPDVNPLSVPSWHFLLKLGIGVISGLSLLSGDFVGATTESPKKLPVLAPLVKTSKTITKNVHLPPPKISVPSTTKNTIAGKNNYIDTTNYSQPTPVVLTERSTGCRTTVSNGELQSANCSSGAVKTTIVQKPYIRRSSQYYATNTVNKANISKPVPPQYNRVTRLIPHLEQGNTALLFPLAIPAAITSTFGWRIHPILGTQRFHSGIDIGAPLGTPVLAVYPGEVVTAEELGGYGKVVILRHENNTQESRYAHLSEIFVQPGELVEQGRVIGLVGSTGLSSGPHLHFEWRHLSNSAWVPVDAGTQLEYAMENLIRAIQVAKTNPDSQG